MKNKNTIRIVAIVVAAVVVLGLAAWLIFKRPSEPERAAAPVSMVEQAVQDGKEVVTTLTFEPGATLAAIPAVADLSAAAAIRLNSLTGGYGALTLVLSNVDSFAAQFGALTDGLFVKSDILGEKPVYIAWADLQKFMEESMKTSGMASSGMGQFGQSFAASLQSSLATGKMVGEGTESLTEEQIKQKVIESMGGDDSVIKWVEAIQAKKVVTAGEFTLEGSDVATTKTELTVTKEDMAALYALPYVQKQMLAQVRMQDPTMTDAQADAKVKELVSTINDALMKSDAQVLITVLTKGEDDMVALNVKATGAYQNNVNDVATNADGTTTTTTNTTYVPMSFDMVYTSKAVDGGTLYGFAMTGAEKDVTKFTAKGDLTVTDKTAMGTLTVSDENSKPQLKLDLTCDYSDAKHTMGDLAVTLTGDPNIALVFGYDQVVGDATIDTKLTLSNGASVEAIKADAAKALLGTLKINTVVQADSGAFAALKEASPEMSTQIAKMSDSEMQTYLGSLQSNAMQVMYKVLGNLPPSVSSALFNTAGN